MAKLIYEKTYDWYRCSVCQKVFKKRTVEEDFDQFEFQPKLNFCPHCGSPLKEEIVKYLEEMKHAPSYLCT